MAKRSEYKKLGYTDEQINKAIASTGMGGSPVNVAPANTTKAPQAPTTPVAPIAQMSPDAETPANRAGTVSAPQPAPVSQPAVSQPPVSPDNVTPADAAIASVTQKVQAQPATPTQTPTAQKPVETTAKKETAQLGAEGQVKNYDISTGREEEIQSNLTRISAENPALLTDRAKFDQAFGYATADAGKKALLDSFFDSKSTKMDAGSIFSTLLAGGQIPKSNLGSPEFKSASARLAKLRKYSSYSVTQLVSAIGKELIQGSQEYNDLYSTPGGKLKIDQANKYLETNGVNLSETGTKKTDEILNNSLSVKQAIADGVITNEEWASMMNSTEISAKREEVQKKKDRYDTLKAQYDAVEDEVDSELKGTGATSSYRAALIANRRKGMYKDLTVATSEYNNATGTLSDLLKDQGERVDANMALVKDERQFAQQKELALFQADLAVEQAKKKMLLEQGDINSDDPFVRRQAIINQVESLKTQFPTADIQRSTEQIVSDVEKLIASGVPAGQALSDNFVKPFMSKDAVMGTTQKGRYEYKEVDGSLVRVDTWTNKVSPVFGGSSEFSNGVNGSDWINNTGDGKVTFLGGRVKGDYGMDIAGKEGFPISAPTNMTAIAGGSHKDYGNYVDFLADDGSKVRVSHLDPADVSKIQNGQRFGAGDFISKQKNTGTVIAGSGRGVVDITTWGADGKVRTGAETQSWLMGLTPKEEVTQKIAGDEVPAPMNKFKPGTVEARVWDDLLSGVKTSEATAGMNKKDKTLYTSKRSALASEFAKQTNRINTLVTTNLSRLFGGNASDTDRALLNGIFTQGAMEGKGARQIMKEFSGLYDQSPLADKLFSAVADSNAVIQSKSRLDASPINRMLQNGDLDGAVSFTERLAINNANSVRGEREKFIPEDVEVGAKAIGLLEKMVNNPKLKEALESPGELRLQDWLPNELKDNPEYMEYLAIAGKDNSEIRNRLAGSAVTEVEAKFLDSFLLGKIENYQSASVKLRAAKESMLRRVNAFRSQAGLPNLPSFSYLDTTNPVSDVYITE